MKWKKRYYSSWLYSTLFMYILSYLWHGVFLNDIEKVTYSPYLFYTLSVIVYLFIGYILTMLTIRVDVFSKKYINGTFIGGIMGFFIYLIAFVLGVSFVDGSSLDHVAIDFMWQMMEQGAGGILAGFLYSAYREMDKIEI